LRDRGECLSDTAVNVRVRRTRLVGILDNVMSVRTVLLLLEQA